MPHNHHTEALLADSSESTLTPITVTVATARKVSGLGNTTLWALIKEKKLEVVRVGRRTLVTYASLQALLAPTSKREAPSSASK